MTGEVGAEHMDVGGHDFQQPAQQTVLLKYLL